MRDAEFKEACSRYDALLAARSQESARLSALRHAAWNEKRYFVWLLRWLPSISHRLVKSQSHPVRRNAGRDEIMWNIGGEGEQKVRSWLSERLDQSWTLICGYRNAKGEADQLLVGPVGIVAIEIKNVNGRVSCDRDRWWRDKTDKYGNVVEHSIPIADKGGRGPSRQVNDVADLLECQLRKHGLRLPRIIRVVILAHDKSRLGIIRNSAVDIVNTLNHWDLGRLHSVTALSSDQVQRVVDSICREHQLFDNGMRKPNSPAGRQSQKREK